jgi:general secretion pathway protein N
MAFIEMKPGRALSLLTGVALLVAVARFNEMTPDAQASFLDAAAATARSLLHSAVLTYDDIADKAKGALQERAARTSAAQLTPQHAYAEVSPRIAAHQPDAEPPASTGNPLWALPVKQLSVTRERPLFSPSRRPPPPAAPAITPVVVQQPVKPPEPERPAVSLVGTIIGPDDQIGVFLDTGTHTAVRLRLGEDHRGWVLRLITAREVTLVKDSEQAVTLELRPPGDAAPALAVPALPPSVTSGLPGVAPGTIPIISREVSADEQPVRSRAAGPRRR